MEKYIYDEKNGLHYELIGDFYYPCLTAPEPAQIGVWGMRRCKFLRENNKVVYINLLTTDKLNEYLEEIDRQAEEMYIRLVEQLKATEGVTEQLKADHQMEWVRRMNNIRNRATEIVNMELIYT